MAGYLDELGGPMSMDVNRILERWLHSHLVVESYESTFDPIAGVGEKARRVVGHACHVPMADRKH